MATDKEVYLYWVGHEDEAHPLHVVRARHESVETAKAQAEADQAHGITVLRIEVDGKTVWSAD